MKQSTCHNDTCKNTRDHNTGISVSFMNLLLSKFLFWTWKVVAIKKMELPPPKIVDGERKLSVDGEREREFRVEVDILSRLEHPNLVTLIGYCADGKNRFLVYEYMHKGNLQDHLNGWSLT